LRRLRTGVTVLLVLILLVNCRLIFD